MLTLVTLFRSSNQFYRAECFIVSGFFYFIIHVQASHLFLIRGDGWHCLVQVGPWQNQFFWASTVAGSGRITNIISMPDGHFGVSNRAGHEWLISENSDYSCQQYDHLKLLSGKLAARRPERNCRLWIVSQSTSSLQQTPLIKKDSRPCSPLNGHLADKLFKQSNPWFRRPFDPISIYWAIV